MIAQSLLDSLPFGVIVTDVDLRLEQVNQWLMQRRAPGGEGLIGRLLAEAFPELVERSLLPAYDLARLEARPVTLPASLYGYFLRMPAEAAAGFDDMPQSTTIVPLLANGQVVGTLTVIEDVTQRLHTERQLQREIDRLMALQEVDRKLATLDLQDCLQIIVERARNLFGGENSALLLLEGNELVVEAVLGYDPAMVGRRLLPTQGLAGWAAAHREPLLVPDVSRDPRYYAVDAAVISEMVAPLLLQDKCIGVIDVESRRAAAFSARDLDTLEWLAARAAAAIHNARLHAAEREQRTLADTLADIGLSLATELNPDAILDTLLDHVARVVPYDTASVLTLDAQSGKVRIARQHGYERFGVAHLVAEFEMPLASLGTIASMASQLRPLVVPRTADHPGWVKTELAGHIQSWAGAPILARGQVLGFLSLDKTEPGFYTLEMAERLAIFAAQAGLAIENARLFAAQQRLAVTDSLTGIGNRRFFDQELARELQRANRFKRSTALIMLDLDDFKRYNDRYGHPAGDELLRAIAVVVGQSIRMVDTLARYGGEEFVLILPETEAPAACEAAERLRVTVAALPLLPAETPLRDPDSPVTISLGVAVAPHDGASAGAVVQAADDALYRAKRAGKNRVALFHETARDRRPPSRRAAPLAD